MRRRLSRRSRGPRRKTQWEFGWGSSVGAQEFITASIFSHWALWPVGTWDDSNQSFPGDTVAHPTDLTLVRSLNYWYAWAEAPGGDFDFNVAIGMGLIKFAHPDPGLIDGQNFVSGDQVPGVLTNPTMDWVWRTQGVARVFGNVSGTFLETDIAGAQSRAMRKLSQNEGLLQTLEMNIIGSDQFTPLDVAWYMESRMLLKEA